MVDAGLILEGGGMRGVYTAGALDCLMDEQIEFAQVYGTSAGVCHACSYKSRQRGRAVRTVTDFLGDRHYAGIYSLLTTGDFFGVRMIYDEIPNKLIPFDYDTFAANPMLLYAVVTNCRSGRAEYLPVADCRRDLIAVRASSSLPMLSRKVEIGGEKYLDGGISDSIPLAASIAASNRKNFVILTQHDGYRKGPNRLMPAIRARYYRYPALTRCIAERHLRYNEALDLIAAEQSCGNAFVLQPEKPVEIDRLEKNRDKLLALYRQGYDDMQARLPALCAFLQI